MLEQCINLLLSRIQQALQLSRHVCCKPMGHVLLTKAKSAQRFLGAERRGNRSQSSDLAFEILWTGERSDLLFKLRHLAESRPRPRRILGEPLGESDGVRHALIQ